MQNKTLLIIEALQNVHAAKEILEVLEFQIKNCENTKAIDYAKFVHRILDLKEQADTVLVKVLESTSDQTNI